MFRAWVDSHGPANADRVQVPEYSLGSAGPDYLIGAMARRVETVNGTVPIYNIMAGSMGGMMNMGQTVQYDPTNGTVSEGDIVTFGP